MDRAKERETFRPRWPLAAATAVGGAIWVAVLIYLLTFDGVPTGTLLSTLFFIAFFAGALTYYGRTAIFVDAAGMTFRGMVRTKRFSFTEIRKVDVMPGLVTVYAVRSEGRRAHFTSFFSGHERLAALLIERSGLTSR